MKILVVDDHPIMRQGIRALLAANITDALVEEADSIDTALTCAASSRPDVAIVDLSLGRELGLDLIRRLRDSGDRTPVLVLSVFDESLHAERALRAGASGYLMKETAPDQLVDAVLRVSRREIVLSAAMQSRLIEKMTSSHRDPPKGPDSLSSREMEVLRLIGEGLSTASIAAKLSRSVKTVETHRGNIQRKLDLDCSAQLVRYATLFVSNLGEG